MSLGHLQGRGRDKMENFSRSCTGGWVSWVRRLGRKQLMRASRRKQAPVVAERPAWPSVALSRRAPLPARADGRCGGLGRHGIVEGERCRGEAGRKWTEWKLKIGGGETNGLPWAAFNAGAAAVAAAAVTIRGEQRSGRSIGARLGHLRRWTSSIRTQAVCK